MRWYLLTCGTIFLIGNLYRIARVMRMPAHLRWDLYPMPRGTSAQRRHGGSYFETSEWWLKKTEHSRWHEITYIAGEVMGFRTLWQRNRPLWLWSWLMHLGLYALVAAGLLTGLASVTDAAWMEWIRWAVMAGAAAGMAGALGLIVVRAGERFPFSGRREYFNLAAILSVCVTALEASSFAAAPRQMVSFVRALLSMGPAPELSSALALHLIVLGAFIVYFPATHMTHAYMKFFAFHRVRWDDTPLAHDAALAEAIAHNLNRPLTWSAAHIRSRQTWAQAASGEEGRG
jgi:hypothetical protein